MQFQIEAAGTRCGAQCGTRCSALCWPESRSQILRLRRHPRRVQRQTRRHRHINARRIRRRIRRLTKTHPANQPDKRLRPHAGSKGSKNSRSSRKRGQQAIDHERARAIQEALIREHYLQGAPSGTWDATTQAAMQRYQADHGWQSKTTPDSRALIKLGLGPSNDHLLNPESAMTSAPAAAAPKTTKPDPAQDNLPHQ